MSIRQHLVPAAVLVFMTLNVAIAQEAKIVLTAAGKSPYTVVYAANATAAEKNAVRELTEHLKKVSGVSLSVKPEGEQMNGPAIYVGQTAFARSHGISFGDFGPEEWLIKAAGKDLVIGGGRHRGTLYGVWEFLERQAGIMWLDEKFTYLPRIDEFAVPDNLELRGKPAFAVRGIYAYINDQPEKRICFMARNRQNLFHDQSIPAALVESWALSPIIGSPRGCHTFYNYTKDWPAEYENCFSLSADGKRLRAVSPSGPGQVCFSNPQTRKLFIARLREYIKADRKRWPNSYPVIYDISANDDNQKCECEKCLALAKKYDSYGGVTLEFINAIADDIAKDYPDIQVQAFAYMFSAKPPKNIKARPNVLMRLAQLGTEFVVGNCDTLRPLTHSHNRVPLKQLRDWSRIGRLAIWDYFIVYQTVGPATNITAMPTNFRIYLQNKVESVFAELEKPVENSFYSLRLWLGCQLMQNPDRDANPLIDKFMNAYYGQAAAPFMRQYLNYLETRMAEVKSPLGNVPLQRQDCLDNAFFVRSEELLTAAEKAAAGDVEILSRIAKERVPVDFARLERAEYLKPGLTPDRREVIGRYKKNGLAAIGDFVSTDQREESQRAINDYVKGLSVNIPLPAEFKGQDVIDITWPRLKDNSIYGMYLVNDPDAAGGRALKLGTPGPNTFSPEFLQKFHTSDLEMGLYSASSKKELVTKKIPRTALAKDEKFHFYPLGKVTLEPNCYVWAHNSWVIQHKLWEFYNSNGLSNEYKIYLSLKVQGLAYVPGSKKEDAVLLDRVILCR
jgi:hypothetical protein